MKTEDITPTWLSYSEAQRLVGLGRTTLWQLVSSGEVKAARVGRAVRLNRQSLERYLERQSGDFE
jgi:excisionase family DNA binding protein